MKKQIPVSEKDNDLKIQSLEALLKVSQSGLDALTEVLDSVQIVLEDQTRSHQELENKLNSLLKKRNAKYDEVTFLSLVDMFAANGSILTRKKGKTGYTYSLSIENSDFQTLELKLNKDKMTIYGCPKSFEGNTGGTWTINGLKNLACTAANVFKVCTQVYTSEDIPVPDDSGSETDYNISEHGQLKPKIKIKSDEASD